MRKDKFRRHLVKSTNLSYLLPLQPSQTFAGSQLLAVPSSVQRTQNIELHNNQNARN